METRVFGADLGPIMQNLVKPIKSVIFGSLPFPRCTIQLRYRCFVGKGNDSVLDFHVCPFVFLQVTKQRRTPPGRGERLFREPFPSNNFSDICTGVVQRCILSARAVWYPPGIVCKAKPGSPISIQDPHRTLQTRRAPFLRL